MSAYVASVVRDAAWDARCALRGVRELAYCDSLSCEDADADAMRRMAEALDDSLLRLEAIERWASRIAGEGDL
jgi:hypothetical protein